MQCTLFNLALLKFRPVSNLIHDGRLNNRQFSGQCDDRNCILGRRMFTRLATDGRESLAATAVPIPV